MKKTVKIEELNHKQELFCQLFTDTDNKDFFGNGVQCYIEAYEPKQVGNWYNSAKASASRMLTKVYIINRINKLLGSKGFNDQNVDKQHLFLLNQYADLKTKMSAIKEYNAVKGRLASQKIKIEGKVEHSQNTENYKEIQDLKANYELELANTLRNKKVVDEQ